MKTQLCNGYVVVVILAVVVVVIVVAVIIIIIQVLRADVERTSLLEDEVSCFIVIRFSATT